MEIFDSHLHLAGSGDLNESFSKLVEDCQLAEVRGGLIICMQNDPWDFEAVAELTDLNKDFRFAINPNLHDSRRALERAVKDGKRIGAAALKIHPRIQEINLQSKEVRYLVHQAKDLELPIIICAFNDGSWSRIGLTNDQFIKLADDFPDVKFLWAHAGGHNVLDFMFMARRVPNVFLDSSFTQSYFFKGTIMEDLNYATESLPTRFMFGTDFEQGSYAESVIKLSKFYLTQNSNRGAFFADNYKRFLGIDE
jgi:predicted TIM-barrel fold metal-dependent hydrolase